MNEQEKFDELLRSKLSERDFPFDETNWDKAETLIDRSEKRRRYGIIAFIFLAGIGVGAALMLPFINTGKTNVIANTQSVPQNISSNGQVQNVIASSGNNGGTQAGSGQVSVATAPGTNVVNSNQPIATANTSVQEKTNTTSINSAGTVSTTKTVKTRKHAKHSATDNTVQYNYVRPESNKKSNKSHKADITANNAIVTNARAHDSSTVSGNANAIQANQTNIVTNNISGQNSNPTHSSNPVTNANNVSDIGQIVVNTINKTDSSTSTTHLVSTQTPPKKNGYSHTLFSADAGGGYSFGWKKAGETQGNGLSPIFGISVTHYLTKSLSAFAGLQYNSMTNINTLYSTSQTQYDFGYNSTVNSITIKTLYYIALPLKLQYNISNNNIISAGVNLVYLMTTNSSVVSYSQNYFGTSGYTTSTKMGYADGLNNYDAQITLACRRKINRFTASIEGYYGLLDIENNNFFENNVFERNSGLRFILSYDIIK